MPWSYWSQNSDATTDSQKEPVSIIRIYSPVDLVIRKRPAETSTNAAIVRPVFGDEYTRPITALTTEGRMEGCVCVGCSLAPLISLLPIHHACQHHHHCQDDKLHRGRVSH
jgi:hypothetical protein